MTKTKTKTPLPPHPDQPIYLDSDRRPRFRENKIVYFLLHSGPFDLNQIASMPWDNEDYTHLMQLIGYSTDGYGELSTSPPEKVARADVIGEKLRKERDASC